jgi:uncharacterized protein
LHVVRGTRLARDWRNGGYRPWTRDEYVTTAADLIAMTPPGVVFHRLTATARAPLLLAPDWCAAKWPVLNAIEAELARAVCARVAPVPVPCRRAPKPSFESRNQEATR